MSACGHRVDPPSQFQLSSVIRCHVSNIRSVPSWVWLKVAVAVSLARITLGCVCGSTGAARSSLSGPGAVLVC